VTVENLADAHFLAVFELVFEDDLAKEGVEDVLTVLAEQPDLSAEEAVEEAGLGGVDDEEVREIIVGVVERNSDQVAEEGMAAFSGLMGECMGELRGKADGETISSLLREEIGKRS
jgi:glutamyl-tRNA(Gln) amidotransferase subunit E